MLMMTRSVYGTAMSCAKSHAPPRSTSLSANSAAMASIASCRFFTAAGLNQSLVT